jgi:hypothetical protein
VTEHQQHRTLQRNLGARREPRIGQDVRDGPRGWVDGERRPEPPLRLPDGSAIGFIDVPGHERFVRNMLAGVSGIDFVLLVVAADDGVMPQTREHLAILDLLDVRDGLLVITKCDRVPAARVEAVTVKHPDTTSAPSPRGH